MTKTQKSTDGNQRFKGVFDLQFDDKKAATVDVPEKIHIMPIGSWGHDAYGPITISSADIREFITNFNAKVRKGVFITAGHEGWELELPAVGWFTELEERADGLWGTVEWNSKGKEAIADKQFKFFSPEMCRDYEDPQSHVIYRNVLTGGALTKSPYFKELEAIVFSDKNIKNKFNENNNNNMNLQDLLAKDIATLTDEEKSFIKDNSTELNDEQKVTYASIIEVATETPAEETPTEETPVVETETPAEETPVEGEDKGADEEPEAKEGEDEDEDLGGEIQADDKVTFTKENYSAVKQNYAAGQKAIKELYAIKISNQVSGLVFSESNSKGKFLPKSADSLRKFMGTLNEGQLLAFNSLIKEIPETKTVFGEIGKGGDDIGDGTAVSEFNGKIAEKMKAEPTMKYSDAMKAVFTENEGLSERYSTELKPAKKESN